MYHPNYLARLFCAGCGKTHEIGPINVEILINKEKKLSSESQVFSKKENSKQNTQSNSKLYEDCILALEALGSKKRKVNKEIVDAYLDSNSSPSLENFIMTGLSKPKEIRL